MYEYKTSLGTTGSEHNLYNALISLSRGMIVDGSPLGIIECNQTLIATIAVDTQANIVPLEWSTESALAANQ